MNKCLLLLVEGHRGREGGGRGRGETEGERERERGRKARDK